MEFHQPTGAVVRHWTNVRSERAIVMMTRIALEVLLADQITVKQLEWLEVIGITTQIAALVSLSWIKNDIYPLTISNHAENASNTENSFPLRNNNSTANN